MAPRQLPRTFEVILRSSVCSSLETKGKARRQLQERIDIIAFVSERLGADDDEEIRRTILFAANPRTNGSALVREFPVALPPEQRDPLHRSLGGA
jgi:hypothetical protein